MTSTHSGAATCVARLMSVLQFGDSLLPIGSFAFSNGLESAVEQHVVQDRATLSEYVLTASQRAATTDGIALLAAHRAAVNSDIEQVNAADCAAYNRKLNEETRTMSVRMGRKLAELGTSIFPAPILGRWLTEVIHHQTAGTYPAALAVLFADLGSPEEDAFAVHQYGVAMATLSAALRLMRVEPGEVQAILRHVSAQTPEQYAVASAASLADMAAFTPMADILAAIHVRAHVRMFMN